MTREPEAQTETVLREFLSLEIPEGYRAQLIDGEIFVTPPPGGNHEHCISLILEQVFTRSATRMHVSGNKGLIVSAVTGQNLVIPDLAFAPADLSLFVDAPPWMPPAGVVMVVEVTSSMPDRDRTAKRRAYAAALIPLYLLVDRDEQQIILFAEPTRREHTRREYTRIDTVPFGEGLKLPAPFSFTLETYGFVA
jgi:Uma2 family endonuclease